MGLKYTGGGYGGFVGNVPARDLTDDEVKAHGGEESLLATGLYERETGGKLFNHPPDKRKEEN